MEPKLSIDMGFPSVFVQVRYGHPDQEWYLVDVL